MKSNQKNILFIFILMCFFFLANINAQVNVVLPSISGEKGTQTSAAISISNLNTLNVTAYQFRIYYDKNVVYLTGIDIAGTLTPTQPTINADTLNGKLVVAWASAFPLSGTGTLIKLKMKFKEVGNTSLTTVGQNGQTFILNSGIPTVNTSYGQVTTTTPVQQYSVSTLSNPDAGGKTSGGGTYNSGSNVTVVATQNSGYIFSNWTENSVIVSTNPSFSFTIGVNRSLVANFAPIKPSITLSSNPINGGTTNGGGIFDFGTSVTVTATENSGYSFVNWTENGNIVSNSSSYTFIINTNRNLVANFLQKTSTNPSIMPTTSSSTVAKGSEFWVEIKAGDPNTVSNLYGVSFKLTSSNSNCTYVDGSAENGGFIGTGSSVLFFPHRVNDQTVDIGISKISGAGANGSGIIAKVKFITSSSIPSGQTITFTLSNISASNSSGQEITFSASTLSVTVSSTVDVYPGDCNNDKIVNSSDIIRIGLYYGQTRPGSNSPGSTWQAYAREPWAADGSAPTRIYADANGDGSINSADIIPVGLNYAKIHPSIIQNDNSESVNTPLAKITGGATIKPVMTTTVKRNTPFQVQVKIGDPAAVQNLFGISFKLQSNKSTCNYIDGSVVNSGFLGSGSSVLFFPQKVNEQTVDIGLSKTSGSGINGSGIIATAQFSSSVDQTVIFSLADVTAVDNSGNSIQLDVQQSSITVDINEEKSIPVAFALDQNYPNPFNPTTTIKYELPQISFVSLKVYDILGKEVANLEEGNKNAGRYEVKFDGSNLSSGIYFYQIRAGNFTKTNKLILMK